MDRVAEIRKLSRGKYRVTLEGGLSFPLYAKELSTFEIREEGEIPEETAAQIMEELLPKRARLYALHLLERMDRTESQLREKLALQSYPEGIITDAVEYVRSYHYIDDLRYAKNYLENHASSKSLRQMEQDLLLKGIDKETITAAKEEAELPDEEAQIQAWLIKKRYDPSWDPKEKQRLYAFLIRKGYCTSAVTRALRG